MKKAIRVIAICLAWLILFNTFSIGVLAESSAEPVEVVSMREEYVKHFLMPDGTYQAVVYPYPVHVLDEKGLWIDIKSNMVVDNDTADNLSPEASGTGSVVSPASDITNPNPSIDDGGSSGSGTSSATSKIIFDTYIASGAQTVNYGKAEVAWVSNTYTTYMRASLPSFPENAIITTAYLNIYYYLPTPYGSVTVGAYQVLNSWTETGLTWNTANANRNLSMSSIIQCSRTFTGSTSITSSSPAQGSFEITKAARNWLSGESDNFGVALRFSSGNVSSVAFKAYEGETAYRPTFTYNYKVVNDATMFSTDSIASIQYTNITSATSDHLLSVAKSNAIGYDLFTVVNQKNQQTASYIITDDLANSLLSLEEEYQEKKTSASTQAQAAHAAKLETEQLVTSGRITSGSSEYYGTWASNTTAELELLAFFEDYIDTYTSIYCVYLACCTYYAALVSSNSTLSVTSSQYANANASITQIADDLTYNPNSTQVVLGKSTANPPYYQVAQSKGATYFYADQATWDSYTATYGSNAMDAANREFIYRQLNAGKQVWFSNDPINVLAMDSGSAFAAEIRWIMDYYGIAELTAANIVKSGSYWYLIP